MGSGRRVYPNAGSQIPRRRMFWARVLGNLSPGNPVNVTILQSSTYPGWAKLGGWDTASTISFSETVQLPPYAVAGDGANTGETILIEDINGIWVATGYPHHA